MLNQDVPAMRMNNAVALAKSALLTAVFNVLRYDFLEPSMFAAASGSEEARSLVADLISTVQAVVAITQPKDRALYAINAPLLLDLDIRFSLSEMIQSAMFQIDYEDDADALDVVAGQQVVKWLHDAVTVSGNTAEKSRSNGLRFFNSDRNRMQDGLESRDPSPELSRGRRRNMSENEPPPGALRIRSDNYEAGADFSEDYIKRTSLIAQIRDLFPELGEGFIEACLIVFEDDAEKVIMSVLEDQLPSSLQQLDRNMPRALQYAAGQRQPIPTPTDLPPSYEDLPVPSVLSERRNVFDGDEFDLLASERQGAPEQSILLGKRK
jgi:hypothetical protein